MGEERAIERLRELGVEIPKAAPIVVVGRTPTVVGRYEGLRLNFAVGEIAPEDARRFTTVLLDGRVLWVHRGAEADALKKRLRRRNGRQLKLRGETPLSAFELSPRERLELMFLEHYDEG